MFIQTASAIFKHFNKQNENHKAADFLKAKNTRKTKPTASIKESLPLINNFSSKERTLTLAEVQNFILNYKKVTFKNYITPLISPFLRNWKNITVAKDVTQLQTKIHGCK